MKSIFWILCVALASAALLSMSSAVIGQSTFTSTTTALPVVTTSYETLQSTITTTLGSSSLATTYSSTATSTLTTTRGVTLTQSTTTYAVTTTTTNATLQSVGPSTTQVENVSGPIITTSELLLVNAIAAVALIISAYKLLKRKH